MGLGASAGAGILEIDVEAPDVGEVEGFVFFFAFVSPLASFCVRRPRSRSWSSSWASATRRDFSLFSS